MPILVREPDIFPSDLFDRPAIENGATWWVLYTMSRREKQLMRCLHTAEISFYAPLVRQRKRSPAGRQYVTYATLFPGYVFLKGDDDQRRAALTTNCVSRCISVSDPARLTHDLQQIRRLIEAEVPLSTEKRLEPGERVRVSSGPLIGLEGTVIRRHGDRRLLVAVQFLQQGTSVQLDDFAVERID